MASPWRLSGLPPCSNEGTSKTLLRRPTKLEGIYHLVTFKGMLSSYIVGSTAVGYYMAPGQFSLKKFALVCGGTALTVLSANAWNQIFESESDSRMVRTSSRYLPSGGSVPVAVTFATLTGVAGGSLLWRYVNPIASCLAVSNIALYGVIYTPMKKMHWINTWVGAIVGAIPPMIGWAGKTNHLEFGSWVLGGLLFFWQMPHFQAIAWKNQEDYERGGYKMLVNTNRDQVAGVAFRYSVPLLFVGPLSYMAGMTSEWFMLTSAVPSIYSVLSAYPFYVNPTIENARKLFFSSLLTLPLFCGLMMFHRKDDPTAFQRWGNWFSNSFSFFSGEFLNSIGYPHNRPL